MNKQEKKIQIKCSICGTKVSLTSEEVKQNKNFDTFIIRHGQDATVTAIQAGTLCDECLLNPLEKRIVTK